VELQAAVKTLKLDTVKLSDTLFKAQQEVASTKQQLVTSTGDSEILSRAAERNSHETKALKAENESLRNRKVLFEALQFPSEAEIDATVSKKLKLLQRRVKFYEAQLKEADETLSTAKSAWDFTSTLLMTEVQKLETSLTEEKRSLSSAMSGHLNEQDRYHALELKLEQANADFNQLTHSLNSVEIQLVQKKVELANCIDMMNDADYQEKEKLAFIAQYKASGGIAATSPNQSASSSVRSRNGENEGGFLSGVASTYASLTSSLAAKMQGAGSGNSSASTSVPADGVKIAAGGGGGFANDEEVDEADANDSNDVIMEDKNSVNVSAFSFKALATSQVPLTPTGNGNGNGKSQKKLSKKNKQKN
jgi:hypothetical protein